MNKITMYTTPMCPSCDFAKMLLDRLGYEYDTIEIDNQGLQDLSKKTGMRSIPQIFVGEKLIGGFDDLGRASNNGELERLVKGE
jgi:glutaredoxin 3